VQQGAATRALAAVLSFDKQVKPCKIDEVFSADFKKTSRRIAPLSASKNALLKHRINRWPSVRTRMKHLSSIATWVQPTASWTQARGTPAAMAARKT
jgi:hypothetical protein